MPLRNWLDGSVVLTGTIDRIMNFITEGLSYDAKPVQAKIIRNEIVFSDGFIAEELYVLNTREAFIGFAYAYDIRATHLPNLFQASATWDQLYGLEIEELIELAKLYRLMFQVEGYIYDLETREIAVVDEHGIVLFEEYKNVQIPKNTDDYFLNPPLILKNLMDLSSVLQENTLKKTRFFIFFQGRS